MDNAWDAPVLLGANIAADGHSGYSSGAGVPVSVTVSATPIGAILVVCVADNNSRSPGSVTDNAGNSYVLQVSKTWNFDSTPGDSGNLQIFTAICQASPSTINYQTAGTNPQSYDVSAGVVCFYVQNGSPNIDLASGTIASNITESGSGTLKSTVNFTPKTANEFGIAVGYVAEDNNNIPYLDASSAAWTNVTIESNWIGGSYYNAIAVYWITGVASGGSAKFELDCSAYADFTEIAVMAYGLTAQNIRFGSIIG